MPGNRVAILEGVYRKWARGNFRAGAELLSDDVVFAIDYPHGPQTYFGHEGVERYMRETLAEWDRMEVRAWQIVEVGDRVFVDQHQLQTGPASGLRVEGRTAAIWTFSGGLVVRPQLFQDPAVARLAAGLAG